MTAVRKNFNIFLAFIKIGVIGFGGGSALIPVIEKEAVQLRGWISNEQNTKYTVISNITPGALPVKMGAMIGYQTGGISGSLAAAYAVTLPGVFATLLILSLFSLVGARSLYIIERLSVGITVFIIYLLMHFIVKTLCPKKDSPCLFAGLAICAAAFAVTGGQEILNLTAILTGNEWFAEITPVLDISSINLIFMALYIIVYSSLVHRFRCTLPVYIVSCLYILSVGKQRLFPVRPGFILFAMVILLICAIVVSYKENPVHDKLVLKDRKKFIWALGSYMIFPAILFAACWLGRHVSGLNGSLPLSGLTVGVLTSTLTSFGGGEAYVSVADSTFVGGGYISSQVFYRQIVPVANALPGPILVKLASAIGLIFGAERGGIGMGWLVAAFAMSLAVSMCGIISLIMLAGYDAMKTSRTIRNLQVYILPTICGMLLSTILGMCVEALRVTSSVGISAVPSSSIIAAGVAGIYLFKKKCPQFPDVLLLLICALASGLILKGF